jgi:hypothetical protein
MMTVKATRQGQIGGLTASGYRVDRFVPFVALPSYRALWRMVRVRHGKDGPWIYAIVLDVGPWNEHDDGYVFSGARPAAESGTDTRGRRTNGAGIDLGEHVWHSLGMIDNDQVQWDFIDVT